MMRGLSSLGATLCLPFTFKHPDVWSHLLKAAQALSHEEETGSPTATHEPTAQDVPSTSSLLVVSVHSLSRNYWMITPSFTVKMLYLYIYIFLCDSKKEKPSINTLEAWTKLKTVWKHVHTRMGKSQWGTGKTELEAAGRKAQMEARHR